MDDYFVAFELNQCEVILLACQYRVLTYTSSEKGFVSIS
jgi:hypothetical protein